MEDLNGLIKNGINFSAREPEAALRERVVFPLLQSLGWSDKEIEIEKNTGHGVKPIIISKVIKVV